MLVFLRKKTPEFTKMGKIHELFLLALSLVWFAGATPDCRNLHKFAQIAPGKSVDCARKECGNSTEVAEIVLQ